MKRKAKLADDSMTEQSDDDARLGLQNQQNRLQQRSKAMSSDDRLARNDGFTQQQNRGMRKPQTGHITNIINNNNINNFIINDPSKAPPAFHMAQAHHQQMGLADGRVQTAPVDFSNQDRQGIKQYTVGPQGVYVPSRVQTTGG